MYLLFITAVSDLGSARLDSYLIFVGAFGLVLIIPVYLPYLVLFGSLLMSLD